jgi:AcrR family transcriptional regulator
MDAVAKLPRGRHGLSREAVAHSQRQRMLRAMAEAVSEHGYANTSVAEVLRRARVSRETFYEQFGNKQECFLSAYDASATIMLQTIQDPPGLESGAGAGRVDDQLDQALARYLGALAREPALARTFLVEVYAAGPAALARRVEVQTRFVDAVVRLIGASGDEQRFACEAIVGAVSALVTQRVCAGRTAEVPELHGSLVRFVRASLEAAGITPSAA